jgi:hypothetical protein
MYNYYEDVNFFILILRIKYIAQIPKMSKFLMPDTMIGIRTSVPPLCLCVNFPWFVITSTYQIYINIAIPSSISKNAEIDRPDVMIGVRTQAPSSFVCISL